MRMTFQMSLLCAAGGESWDGGQVGAMRSMDVQLRSWFATITGAHSMAQ
jgi:hypothetical protein